MNSVIPSLEFFLNESEWQRAKYLYQNPTQVNFFLFLSDALTVFFFFFFYRNSLYFCFVLSCKQQGRIRIRILKVSHSTWLARCKSRILKRLPKFVQTLLIKPVSLSVHLQKRRRFRVLSDIKSNFVSYLCTEHHANEICLFIGRFALLVLWQNIPFRGGVSYQIHALFKDFALQVSNGKLGIYTSFSVNAQLGKKLYLYEV